MKWFEGTIPEAINASKAAKAVFVVFIEGKCETSKEVARTIHSPEVSSRLETDKFIAIKLQSDSEYYTFFAQIYQLVPVPSIFFIGENGSPLEIVGNNLPAAELATKIDSILEKVYNKDTFDKTTNVVEAESSKDKKVDEQANNVDGASSQVSSDAENKDLKEISQEEKMKRARELIEIQKKKKQEEDERKEREREIERRKTGRDLQKLRQQQKDKEIRDAQQERLREKAAEQAAREKILKQIAEDKLERKRKLELQMQESQQQKKSQDTVQNKPKTEADLSKTRIQFKLPTGNPITGTFDSTTTLGALRSYVLDNAQLPFRQFSMSAFYPRKDFTPAHDTKTLIELDLAPSSVILIIPVKSNVPTSVIKSSDSPGIFSHFFWTLLAPVVGIYNYVMGYFTGRPRPGDFSGSSSNNNRNNSSTSSSTDGANNTPFDRLTNFGMRKLGNNQAEKIRARGNIHTLHSNDDDNDENNTWNGNSTQQM